MPHLLQPAGHHRRTHTVVVEQHHARLAHADVQVGALHQLPSRAMLRTGQAAGGKFLRGAHVAQEQRALCILLPFQHLLCRHPLHPRLARQGHASRPLLCQRLATVGRIAALPAVLQRQVRQVPALGAVFQGIDGVVDAEVDQGLRADDAARAACTVDHYRCVRVLHQVFQAVAQLTVGATGGAGDVHPGELVQRPAVEQHQRLALTLPFGQLQGADARGVARVLDQLAKGLRWQVHASEQLETCGLPPQATAFEPVYRRVAQGLQAPGAALRQLAAGCIVDHQPHRRVGRQARGLDFQPAVRQVDGVEQVSFAVLAMFAQVEQGDLLAVE
ncbi:hypothetical protein D3C78_941360 [compost metagenome]